MDFHQYASKESSQLLDENSDEFSEKNQIFDKKLIDQVRLHPCLYGTIKSKSKINEAWNNVALALNEDVEKCKSRWVRLRQYYCKERKKLDDNKMLSDKSLYYYMKWIDEHVPKRKKTLKGCSTEKVTISKSNKPTADQLDSGPNNLNVINTHTTLSAPVNNELDVPQNHIKSTSPLVNLPENELNNSVLHCQAKEVVSTLANTEIANDLQVPQILKNNFSLDNVNSYGLNEEVIVNEVENSDQLQQSYSDFFTDNINSSVNDSAKCNLSSAASDIFQEDLHTRNLADITNVHNNIKSVVNQKGSICMRDKENDIIGNLIVSRLTKINDDCERKKVQLDIMKILYASD